MAFAVVSAGIVNADEFKAKLRQMSAEVREEIVEEAAVEGAAPILWEAIRRAPVLKHPDPRRIAGNLATKIERFVLKKQPSRVTVGVGIGKIAMREKLGGAFYALWVEYGTKFMAAIPYLRPAFDAKKDEAGKTTISVFSNWLGKFSQ